MIPFLLCIVAALAGNPEVTPDGPDGTGALALPASGFDPATDGVGTLVIEAAVPVEVAVDGRPTVQMFRPSTVHIPTRVGSRKVTLFLNGRPNALLIDVPDAGTAQIVVGKTGITTRSAPPPDAAANAPVELRVVGDEGLRLVLDEQRYRLSPGQTQALELTRGDHTIEVRSGDGLALYARGDLLVHGTGPVVVQLSAGRAPEVVGRTGSWQPAVR